MTPKNRILVLNNYSVEKAAGEIEDGLKPSHHLYGILELKKRGYHLIVLDSQRNSFWEKLSRLVDRFPFSKMGDLHLQIRALKRKNEYDIVYAPCQDVTQFLGLLSYLGLFKKRVIAIGHHPIAVGRASFLRKFGYYFTLKGHFKWGALSLKVADEINAITKSEKAECFHWGPELPFYDKASDGVDGSKTNKPVDLIAIGRTGRDYQVLIDAFNNTEIIVEIYCAKEFAQQLTTNYTANIKVFELDEAEGIKYPQLIKLYKTAKIMAIPLMDVPDTLAGLTSLTDAIALGMPVIMTKNKYLEIDIEKEEIGYWIDACNSDQWRIRTEQMIREVNMEKFSYNSRKLAENGYNSGIFLSELLAVIETA